MTRLTLFVPGEQRLTDTQLNGEWIENPLDGSFGQAFSFGTVDPELVEEIDRAPGALLVELTDDLLEGRQKVLEVVKLLQAQGALAIRLEQSKLGWTVKRWLEVLASDDPYELHGLTTMMLTSGTHVTTCGMHAFSLPEACIELDEELDEDEGRAFLAALNAYQIGEDPLLLSGQTFTPDEETPKRPLERWPDDRYPPSHWCHNPFGVWHLGPAGGKGTPQPELHFQFIPALVTVLAALERQEGALTRQQVEAIRDKAACMAVSHRDAQKLERSRGYADIDPELVWEQWQVVSGNEEDEDEDD